jgi:hyperosmotically inducible periplasmic protein
MGQNTKLNICKSFIAFGLVLLLGLSNAGYSQDLGQPQNRQERQTAALKEEVRHQLVTLPYFSVFDWLEAQVTPDGMVTLMGLVTQPTLKNDAEFRIKRLESANGVVNKIEVLPLSNHDDQLRIALYRAIYNGEGPLFKYAMRSVGPIHILVKNGHVTLKGVVATEADKNLAGIAANGVSGVFEMKNELKVESSEPIS